MALVGQRTALSPADNYALTLYKAGDWLPTDELRALQGTAVYQRGKELHLRLFGSTGDEYDGDDPLCQRRDRTLRVFEFVFHRDPKPGDILRASELIECWRSGVLADFGAIIAAWQRSLPGLSCPLRVEERARPVSPQSRIQRPATRVERVVCVASASCLVVVHRGGSHTRTQSLP